MKAYTPVEDLASVSSTVTYRAKPAATTACHSMRVLKKEDPCSTANRMPPMGAPKAAEEQ